MIRTLKVLGNWSLNQLMGKKRPLVATFCMTHYCNFYCPMCSFGDPDKEGQLELVMQKDLTTEQWKQVMSDAANHCVWAIIEGGEPTSREDIIELLQHLKNIGLPVTLITNGSLLHKFDMEELKSNVTTICCSVDSVREDAYCKVRGVNPAMYRRVMDNVKILADYDIPRAINAVITKWNAEEFVTGEYFDFVKKELNVHAMSLTFVEDRPDAPFSLAPDVETKRKVSKAVLDYTRKNDDPFIALPMKYWEQILDHGHTVFDHCGSWKTLFVQADGSIIMPCFKFDSPENRMSVLEHNIEEIWNQPQWQITDNCNACENLACVWYSSQGVFTVAEPYLRGILALIKSQFMARLR
ncbi:MAG: radical SAM protein [Nitrososphaerales archaeon]